MKILSIRLKNLASLPEANIDFTVEPLKSAGIFAITGATGAGKSTILDALCLALYAESPRYKQAGSADGDIQDVKGKTIKQDDVRGILRDGTADGAAEVEFMGVDNLHYRATWRVRRARNKIEESLQADTLELLNITQNINLTGKKTETKKEIERRVGLNYEQFTRSVLLAQGDFSAFLKAKNDERASLLEKLTGTNIYTEISRLVYRKADDAKKELENLERQIKDYIVYTDGELQIMLAQVDALSNNIQLLERQASTLTGEINWHHTLAQLRQEKDAADEKLRQAVQEKTAVATRAVKLAQISSVQEIRGAVASKKETESQIEKQTNELNIVAHRINQLKHELDTVSAHLHEAQQAVTMRQQEIDSAQPSIQKAKELDVRLQEKELQVRHAKEQLSIAENKKQQCQNAADDKTNAVAQTERALETLIKWKNDNAQREAIADNIEIILSKLADAGTQLANQQRLEGAVSNAVSQKGKKENEMQQLMAVVERSEAEIKAAREVIAMHATELAATDFPALKETDDALQHSLRELVAAKGHWALLHNSNLSVQQLKVKQLNSEKELKAYAEIIQQKQLELQTSKIQKETSDASLTHARWVAAENVEALRNQLTEGAACPVCGSKEHPYREHYPPLKGVLDALEGENRRYVQRYEQLLAECASNEQKSQNIAAALRLIAKDLEVELTKYDEYVSRWDTCSLSAEMKGIPDVDKVEWLNTRERQVNHTLQETQAKIRAYSSLKDKAEAQRKLFGEMEKVVIENENKRQVAAINLQSISADIERFQEQLVDTTIQISSILRLLEPFFNKPEWVENWKAGPAQFVANIASFAKTWREKLQRLAAVTQELEVQRTSLAAINVQLTEAILTATDQNDVFLKVEGEYKALKAERSAIFNNEPISTVEKRLRDSLAEAQAKEKNAENARIAVTQQLTIGATNQEHINKQIIELSRNLTHFDTGVATWLSDYEQRSKRQLSAEALDELLSYSYEWIQKEQQALRDIDEALIRATTAYEERERNFIQHEARKTSAHTLQELMEMQTAIKEEIATDTTTRTELGYRLREDAANKGKIMDLELLIAQKNDICENWGKLNDLIGSADGKKFKLIAQEYTLDVLLGYANIHLDNLTTRYTIQRIPNSLSMQVVDSEMGDEIRTVYSLSGGETFLVSLALALGLASLSSELMTIESLFIDEGFGALDPTTLSIAMEALERLHNKGRKVGIITHVQEMTERIATQVKVNKQTNGRSKVEVVG